MVLPDTYTSVNETGCCAIPAIKNWDDRVVEFSNEPFISMETKSVFHIPLNMGHVMTELAATAGEAGATPPPEQVLILSREMSPWRTEHLYRVTRPVDGAENVPLNGTFLTKVFEGPYQEAKEWSGEMVTAAKEQGKEAQEIYFCYTTCPACSEHYGKNYVIGFARLSGAV